MKPIQGTIRAIGDHVLVTDMKFDQRVTRGGIIILDDNGKEEGIRPRWGKVYAVGPDQKDILVGQWILVAHGRWTRGIPIEENGEVSTIRRVDVKDIMLVSDEQPADADM